MVLNNIKEFKLNSLDNPKYIKSSLASYYQNDIKKSWEIVSAHDSVAILIYHKIKEKFILVKQFRAPVYMHNQDGVTVELCAGLVDKDKTLIEIAQEEIFEECGYRVSLDNLKKVTTYNVNLGQSGNQQTLYYCEVDDSMRVSNGGGVDMELIEVVEISVNSMKELIFNETITKASSLMFAFYWWMDSAEKSI